MPPALLIFRVSVWQKLPVFFLTRTGFIPDGIRRLLAVFSCSFFGAALKGIVNDRSEQIPDITRGDPVSFGCHGRQASER
jgi:hypothetical protein